MEQQIAKLENWRKRQPSGSGQKQNYCAENQSSIIGRFNSSLEEDLKEARITHRLKQQDQTRGVEPTGKPEEATNLNIRRYLKGGNPIRRRISE